MRALPLLVLLAGAPARAQGPVAASTATAPARRSGPVFGGPLRLRFLLDQRGGARGELGLAVRWDVSDLPGLPRRAAELALDPFGTTARAAGEALSGAEVGVYSLHFKAGEVLPVGLLLGPLSVASAWLRPPAALTPLEPESAAAPAVPADRRRRLNLEPVQEELHRGLRRELRRALINAGFDLAVPMRRPVPFGQKEQVVKDIQRAGEVLEEDLDAALRP